MNCGLAHSCVFLWEGWSRLDPVSNFFGRREKNGHSVTRLDLFTTGPTPTPKKLVKHSTEEWFIQFQKQNSEGGTQTQPKKNDRRTRGD